MNQLTRRARSNQRDTFLGDVILLVVITACGIGYAYHVIEWALQ